MTIYEHDRRIQTLKHGISITSVKLKTHKSFGNIYDMSICSKPLKEKNINNYNSKKDL